MPCLDCSLIGWCCPVDVRYWPLADILSCGAHVCFWGFRRVLLILQGFLRFMIFYPLAYRLPHSPLAQSADAARRDTHVQESALSRDGFTETWWSSLA